MNYVLRKIRNGMEITHLQVYYYFADSDFLGSKLAAKLASTSSLQEKQKFFLQGKYFFAFKHILKQIA